MNIAASRRSPPLGLIRERGAAVLAGWIFNQTMTTKVPHDRPFLSSLQPLFQGSLLRISVFTHTEIRTNYLNKNFALGLIWQRHGGQLEYGLIWKWQQWDMYTEQPLLKVCKSPLFIVSRFWKFEYLWCSKSALLLFLRFSTISIYLYCIVKIVH